jgi:hypothetical protein
MLAKLFGLADKEYHQIVSGFSKMKLELIDLRKRKVEKVAALKKEIADKTNEQVGVEGHIAQADKTLAALASIVG